ncbi:hypothetical protein MMC09_005790 [Bachmanniomyces sp. S44760]|nr:hypothetical protein [Bachmanniomyces sp. S44760]
MAAPSDDVATKISTQAAENHIARFYKALDGARNTIASYYSEPGAMPDGKPLPAIVYNGNIVPDAASFQSMFEQQMPATHHEVQSCDCQVINPVYIASDSTGTSTSPGKAMTILVIVSGFVKIGELKDAAMRGFSETFVLIPNARSLTVKGNPRHIKDFLIQSQNFRLVV